MKPSLPIQIEIHGCVKTLDDLIWQAKNLRARINYLRGIISGNGKGFEENEVRKTKGNEGNKGIV